MNNKNISSQAIKHIGILVFDGVILADVVGIADVYDVLNKLNSTTFPGSTHYQVSVLSKSGGMIASSTPVQIMTNPVSDFNSTRFDALFITSGSGNFDAYRDPQLISWLQKKRSEIAHVAALCTGVLVAGAAGYLNNHRATTHWSLLDKFTNEFPLITIDKEEQIVSDADMYTSCDVGMGVALALKLLEHNLGATVSQHITQNIVACQRRRDATPEVRATNHTEQAINSKVHKASLWLAEHLNEAISITDAADFVSMSERNFTRQFKRETGQTPHHFLLNLRLKAVMQQLSETDLPVDKIARRCGLFSGAQVAKLFRKQMWPSPTEFRKNSQHKAAIWNEAA